MSDVVLVVDDLRMFPFPARYARTSAAALTQLADPPAGGFAELWLDHDLGGDDTAMPVADFLAERCAAGLAVPVRRVLVHSANPVGAANLVRTLTRWLVPAGVPVRRVDPVAAGAWVPDGTPPPPAAPDPAGGPG